MDFSFLEFLNSNENVFNDFDSNLFNQFQDNISFQELVNEVRNEENNLEPEPQINDQAINESRVENPVINGIENAVNNPLPDETQEVEFANPVNEELVTFFNENRDQSFLPSVTASPDSDQ